MRSDVVQVGLGTRKQQMSANLIESSSVPITSAIGMEVTSPVLVAAPEVEKKGSKRPRKDASATGTAAKATEAMDDNASPSATPVKGRKRTVAVPGNAEALVDTATQSLEEASETEKRDSCSSLIVAKAIRVLLKSHSTPIHLGSDALPALNAKVTELIYEAIGRALANGRKTLKNSDF